MFLYRFLRFAVSCCGAYEVVGEDRFVESVQGMKIFCNVTDALITVGQEIDPIECSDDHSPHRNLKISGLPPGLRFDGTYITGSTSMEEFDHRTILYYESDYCVIRFHSLRSMESQS